ERRQGWNRERAGEEAVRGAHQGARPRPREGQALLQERIRQGALRRANSGRERRPGGYARRFEGRAGGRMSLIAILDPQPAPEPKGARVVRFSVEDHVTSEEDRRKSRERWRERAAQHNARR